MLHNSNKPVVVNDEGRFLGNLDLPARPLNAMYIFSLLALLLVATVLYYVRGDSIAPASFLPDSIIIILMIVFICLYKRMQSKPINWFTPDILFMSMFVVFHFSYIVLYAFGVVGYAEEVFWSPGKVHKAILYSLYCIVLFILGYNFAIRKCKKYDYGIFSNINSIPHDISKIMIVLVIIIFWGTLFSIGLGALTRDYKSLISIGGRFFSVSLHIGAVSIAMYCATSVLLYGKAMAGVVKFFTTFFIVGILLLGDRGGFVYLASIPLVAFHYFQRKIKLTFAITMVAGLFFVMAIIGVARTIVVLDVKEMYNIYKTSKSKSEMNAITRSLAEFGGSIKTVVIAMELVPSQYEYWKGKSYLFSTQYVVPNILPGMTRIAGGNITPDVWLTEVAFGDIAETWGRGGSIAMEAYINFGFALGSISFFFLGWLYRVLYERVLTCPNLFNIMFFLGSIGALMYWVRNTSIMFTRTFAWSFIVAYILQKWFCDQDHSEGENETI